MSTPNPITSHEGIIGSSVEFNINNAQQWLCKGFKSVAKDQVWKGRAIALLVAIGDVALDTIKQLLSIIESLAFAVINFVGALLSKKGHSFKISIILLEKAVIAIVGLPAGVLIGVPLKLVHQIFFMVFKPSEARSISSTNISPSDYHYDLTKIFSKKTTVASSMGAAANQAAAIAVARAQSAAAEVKSAVEEVKGAAEEATSRLVVVAGVTETPTAAANTETPEIIVSVASPTQPTSPKASLSKALEVVLGSPMPESETASS